MLPFTSIGALVLISALTVRAQAPPSHVLTSFETVSIEPSTGGLIDVRFSPRNFTARTSTLVELIEQAYGVRSWEIFGGPDWVRVDRFTIRATTAADVPREQMKLMLQALLADRFQLQIDRDSPTVSLYRLTAGTTRNLKPGAKPTERPVINATRHDDEASHRWEGRNATMGSLAVALSQHMRAPVVDDTKLTGNFDFRLEFARDDVFGNREPELTDTRTVFSALEKQLGLKLAGDKGPVSGYVIRRAAKP